MRRRAPTLALLAGLVLPAAALGQRLEDYDYDQLALSGVGVDGGYIWPDKVEATVAFGLRLDLGYLGPAVRVLPRLGYWSSELKRSELEEWAQQLGELLGTEIPADSLGPITWSDLSLGGDVQLVWRTPLPLLAFAGAGGAIHALNGQGRAIEDTFVEDLLDSITPGLAVFAGLEFTLLPRLQLFGEARYTLLTDVQYYGVHAGGSITLPGRGPAPATSGETR